MIYIDADRLKEEIEKRKPDYLKEAGVVQYQRMWAYNDVIELIDTLLQEQPESSKGKFMFPNFLYARTVDNKTIDVSYAPQSIDAVEYVKNDPTEQPEVDFEEILDKWRHDHFNGKRDGHYSGEYLERKSQMDLARYCFELGKNSVTK